MGALQQRENTAQTSTFERFSCPDQCTLWIIMNYGCDVACIGGTTKTKRWGVFTTYLITKGPYFTPLKKSKLSLGILGRRTRLRKICQDWLAFCAPYWEKKDITMHRSPGREGLLMHLTTSTNNHSSDSVSIWNRGSVSHRDCWGSNRHLFSNSVSIISRYLYIRLDNLQ